MTSNYQKKILDRLNNKEILYEPHLGPFTPPAKFRGSDGGINSASLHKLRNADLIMATDKMTNHGLIKFYHTPNDEPWKRW